MSLRRGSSTLVVILLIVATVQVCNHQLKVVAQDGSEDACSDLIEDALQLVGTACIEMGRNEACYGNNVIDVTLQEDVTASFETSGDLIAVADVVSLVTQPANPDAGTWGIAFIAVQADLPDDNDENVTFVLLGDVNLSLDETFEDESTQAFVLESQDSDRCESAPDGMLIQSPQGERARIVVNGVELEMRSSVYLTAEADNVMTIQGLEGQIEVTSGGATEMLSTGFQTTVPLDALTADGEPTPPEPIPPGDAFPSDVQMTLLAVIGSDDSSPSVGSLASLGQVYSDDFATFGYPDGWLVVRFGPPDSFLRFSSDPVFLNALLDNPTTDQPSGTVYGVISTWTYLNEFYAFDGSSADETVRALSGHRVYSERVLQGPLTETIGDYVVTKFIYTISDYVPDGQGTFYGFDDYVIQLLTVGNVSELEALVEAMIASFE